MSTWTGRRAARETGGLVDERTSFQPGHRDAFDVRDPEIGVQRRDAGLDGDDAVARLCGRGVHRSFGFGEKRAFIRDVFRRGNGEVRGRGMAYQLAKIGGRIFGLRYLLDPDLQGCFFECERFGPIETIGGQSLNGGEDLRSLRVAQLMRFGCVRQRVKIG